MEEVFWIFFEMIKYPKKRLMKDQIDSADDLLFLINLLFWYTNFSSRYFHTLLKNIPVILYDINVGESLNLYIQ